MTCNLSPPHSACRVAGPSIGISYGMPITIIVPQSYRNPFRKPPFAHLRYSGNLISAATSPKPLPPSMNETTYSQRRISAQLNTSPPVIIRSTLFEDTTILFQHSLQLRPMASVYPLRGKTMTSIPILARSPSGTSSIGAAWMPAGRRKKTSVIKTK